MEKVNMEEELIKAIAEIFSKNGKFFFTLINFS